MQRRWNSATLATGAGFALLLCFRSAIAQENTGNVVTVIHIDAMPQYTQSAVVLLYHFRRDSLKDRGEMAFQVLEEIDHPNHFTLVEKWVDQKAYEDHNIAPHTREFRDEIQPMLGSPFDERIHSELTALP
jgi:quinol monooxygenase YgiN